MASENSAWMAVRRLQRGRRNYYLPVFIDWNSVKVRRKAH